MKNLTFLIFTFINLNLSAQKWEESSSSNGKIALSWKATRQTASFRLDVNDNGVDDIVLAQNSANTSPSVIWMEFQRSVGWRQFIIEKESLPIEAGGAAHDIDGDGDKDLVFGGNEQSNKLWWWENPAPYFNPNIAWKRNEIKNDGETQHSGQIFGDFLQNGTTQLVFWNQGSKTLFISQLPSKPTTEKWEIKTVFKSDLPHFKPEGLAKADVDGDGFEDIIASNYWFKLEDGKFKAIKYAENSGKIVAAKFKTGKQMQIVVSPSNQKGSLMLYECNGAADEPASWSGRDLLGKIINHGHTLTFGDINGDGNNDIFSAEMTKWTDKRNNVENHDNEAFILYGNGNGGFKKTTFKKGIDFHEGQIGDFDGDGDIDILSKSYIWQAPQLTVWFQNGTGPKQPEIGKTMSHKFGLELYSLRDYFKTDVPGTLAYVKSLGITEVEVAGTYGLPTDVFKDELTKNNITPYSALIGFEDFRDSLQKVIEFAKILGIKNVGCAWIPHKPNLFKKEDADKAIAVFNQAGAALAKEGLHLFYHCHGYEFRPFEDGSLMDYIIKKTDSANVSYEIDVYWAFHGGQDPALMIKKYKDRILALHLKDMKIGQVTGELSGGTPLTSDVAVGTGQLDFKAIMRAAMQTGVKYFYLEDENADVKQHLPISLKNLKALR